MSNYIFVSHAHKSQTRRHPAPPRFTPASCRGNLTLELLIKRGHVSLGGGGARSAGPGVTSKRSTSFAMRNFRQLKMGVRSLVAVGTGVADTQTRVYV